MHKDREIKLSKQTRGQLKVEGGSKRNQLKPEGEVQLVGALDAVDMLRRPPLAARHRSGGNGISRLQVLVHPGPLIFSEDDSGGGGIACGRPVRVQGGGDLPPALGQAALVLVRVLVAAERLGAEELTVAVHADEVARRLRRGRRGVEEGELKVELLLHYTVWLLCEVGMVERGERERA